MAIFPQIEIENIVQVGDLTRINAARSSATPDEGLILKVEIQPASGGSWVDVTGESSDDWHLDWQYAAAGTQTVSVRVTTELTASAVSASKTLSSVSAATDGLFSSDADLMAFEPGIMNYVRPGRASFLDIHRGAQGRILEYLDDRGIRDRDDNRLTAAAIIDKVQVREWARYIALQLIFEGLVVENDDKFAKKAMHYEALSARAGERVDLKIDLDGDGVAEKNEVVTFQSVPMVRR